MNNNEESPVVSDTHKDSSIIQVLVFTLSNEEYGLSLTDIHEVIPYQKTTPVPNSDDFIVGIINLRGTIVPVIDIEKKLHLQKETENISHHIIIAENEKKTLFGIEVDNVIEVLKIPQSEIKQPPKVITNKIEPGYIQGIVVIEKTKESNTERMLVILDIKKVLIEQKSEQITPKPNDSETTTI